MLLESENVRKEKARTDEEEDFFEGIKITYEAVIEFIGRLESEARSTVGSERMAEAFKNLKTQPPKSFYEALLLSYVYFMISEHIDNLQVRSLSGFDRTFYPLYESDLKRGVSVETIRTDLAYYFLQFTAIGNYWNQPVYLGGENEDGASIINELSYLFLDVYDKMGIYNPKIQIKAAESTPKDFLCKALDMIRRGKNSIVFVSDHTIREALKRVGVSPEAARLCNITGCYEYSPIEAYSAGMNYANLMKPLEYALHKGCDGVTGVFCGSESPSLDYYDSFDKLLSEYKRQLLSIIDQTIGVVNAFEDYLYVINPLSLLSATFSSCILKGKDAIGGGSIQNGSIIVFGALADISDSLTMIKKYVYDRREISLPDLVKILDSNYEGKEALRRKLLSDREKYGNNKDLPDSIATEIVEFLTKNICHRKNSKIRGGEWNLGFHVARQSYVHGKKTAASANGRSLGEELSKNVSATLGQSRDGATAAILSATKLDATSFTCDACLDLGLHPSTVKGETGLVAMYNLLLSFIRLKGHALHINVFDADTLRDAQKNPEKYEDLQIRISGWNALWNSIKKEEQDGFIRQAEGLIW